MSLADQIIEHGPYEGGDMLPIEVQVASAEAVNELRDELIAARALKELLGRFQVEADRWTDPVELDLYHDCPGWYASLTSSPTDLAELVQRAAEHAEVCR